MTYLSHPAFTPGDSSDSGGGSSTPTFPLVAPSPGAAGSEPFQFQSGGGLHGTSSGGLALSTSAADALTVASDGTINIPGALSVQGVFTASNFSTSSSFEFPSSASSAPGVACRDQTSTGIFGGINSLGMSVAGASVLSFDASEKATFAGQVAAPSASLSTSLTLGASTYRTCQGNPNGQVTGSVGDWIIDSSSGTPYIKQSGSTTNSGWVALGASGSGGGGSGSASFPLLAPDSQDNANDPNSGYVPEFAFASDASSGMGRSANYPLFFAVAGTPFFRVDTNNLGTVYGDFDVAGTTTLEGYLTAGPTTINGRLSARGLDISGDCQIAQQLVVQTTMQAKGGLSSPSLALNGSKVSAGTGAPEGQVVGATGDLFLDAQDATLSIKTSGSGTAYGWTAFASGGAGSTSFPLLAPNDSAASPSYSWASGNNTGLYLPVGGQLGFTTAGVSAGYIDASQVWNFSGPVKGISASWTTSATSPLFSVTEGATPSSNSAAGQLFVKSSDHNLYFVSSSGVTSQLTPPASSSGGSGSAAGPYANLALTQGATVPAYASGQAKIFANSDGNLVLVNSATNYSQTSPVLRVEVPAQQVYSGFNLGIGNNGETFFSGNSPGSILVLPQTPSTDVRYYFQCENGSAITIQAAPGQTIYSGNTNKSSVNGYMATAQTGSFTEIFIRKGGTTAICRGTMGSWNFS